jgi:hypothetical protein
MENHPGPCLTFASYQEVIIGAGSRGLRDKIDELGIRFEEPIEQQNKQ